MKSYKLDYKDSWKYDQYNKTFYEVKADCYKTGSYFDVKSFNDLADAFEYANKYSKQYSDKYNKSWSKPGEESYICPVIVVKKIVNSEVMLVIQ